MANPATSDRDLASINEARTLAGRAKKTQATLAEFSQEQIDAIVDAMAAAATKHAEASAQAAVDETGYGVVADKVQKNLFASQEIHRFIQPLKTVGVLRRDEARKVVEIAEPFGVVAAVIPSTNPTSTTIYKALIAIKARCPIVLSPHPAATRCITHMANILIEASTKAGAPEGAIGVMQDVTLKGTQELMRHPDVAIILATGGMGLVRSAYSAGKPAYGVGPGNAPAYIERSADVPKAVRDIMIGKTFDNGVLCSSENSVITDEAVVDQVRREFRANGAYFLTANEIDAVGKILVSPQRLPNPKLVGKSAAIIAQAASVDVPLDTRVLIAELTGVGRDYPLSIEKLCPVLSFYVVQDWQEGCERCKQILRYGGMGHTMSIHSKNEEVILEFGLKKPAFRIVVNTPTTHGSIGLTTGLTPAMTLGCGGYGGNITSDNISPLHLLNIKRLAYELKPAKPHLALRTTKPQMLPRVHPSANSAGLAAGTLKRQVDQFLSTRGFHAEISPHSGPGNPPPVVTQDESAVASFVCEDDVRQAHQDGRHIRIDDDTILTPSARDYGEAHDIFIHSSWRD
ncbi:MAG: aldehyde dehydrogenase family protein [Vicinamibacterales bacterium]|nr:aldehyde dehydrogenase family protein [Vicinamibacterales bacterium]